MSKDNMENNMRKAPRSYPRPIIPTKFCNTPPNDKEHERIKEVIKNLYK